MSQKREKIEVTEQPEVTLVSIQAAYVASKNEIHIITQDIVTKHTDFFYNIAGAQISEKSFGVPRLASEDVLQPIVATVDYKDNLETAISSLKDFFCKELYQNTNNVAVDIESLLCTIDSQNFVEMDFAQYQEMQADATRQAQEGA